MTGPHPPGWRDPGDAPIAQDDFQTWLSYPTTKWVMAAAQALADDRKAAWMTASWDAGACQPEYLRELRGQADAYLWLANLDYVGACIAHEQDPVTESR